MADGSPFCLDKTYNVAMTSYRANGGGGLLEEAGVEEDESRIVARLPEIRNILYDYLMTNGTLAPYSFGSILGSWQFVPEAARKQVAADLKLLFP